jgi:hypothetical protein
MTWVYSKWSFSPQTQPFPLILGMACSQRADLSGARKAASKRGVRAENSPLSVGGGLTCTAPINTRDSGHAERLQDAVMSADARALMAWAVATLDLVWHGV